MVFAKWERPIVDEAGNIIANATVEVRRMMPGYPLAVPLYADRDGNTHKDNPFTLTGGDEGRAKFYAVGGRYRIRVYAPGGYDVTYDDEAIGTAQATDTNAYLTPGYTWAPEDQITAPPSAGAVRANNADWSIADHLFVHKSTLSSSEAEAWLLGLAQGGKSIRNRLLLSIADGREMSWEVAGASDEVDYVDLTLDVASYQGPAGPVAVAPSGFITLSREMSGSDGSHAGLEYVFSSTTADADPTAGKFRLNHATHASATAAFIDNANAVGAAASAELDTWDDSTSTVKGTLRIVKKADQSVFRQYAVSGSVVDGTGYRKVTLAYVSGNGDLTDGDRCMLQFSRTGDKGLTGDKGDKGDQGNAGWAPQLVIESDGARRVFKLAGYTGGTGSAPTANVGEYLKADGTFTATIGDAVDVRGPAGANGTGTVADVVAGTGLTVDSTDPANPVVGLSPTTQNTIASKITMGKAVAAAIVFG